MQYMQYIVCAAYVLYAVYTVYTVFTIYTLYNIDSIYTMCCIGGWGVTSIVRRPPNGKSDSVWLRCDALPIGMRCDAIALRCVAMRGDPKLCMRVKKRDSAGWCFK